MSVGVHKWHHGPHTHYIMVQQASQISIKRIVKLLIYIFCNSFHFKPFVGLGIDTCIHRKAVKTVIAITQVTILTQIIG